MKRPPRLSPLRPSSPVAAPLFAALVAACGGGGPESAPPSAPPAPAVAPRAESAAPASPAASAVAVDASASPAAASLLTAKGVPLPGATAPVSMDYVVADRARGRIWAPVGDTGSVDVFDVASGAFTRVDGFKTVEREVRGKKRVMGPSAASVGDVVVYVGNRATSEVCAVDAKTLKLGKCLKLPVPTDGVAYVASSKEVWVTTPRDHSITVLDASKPDSLKSKVVIKLDGDSEGYAVDDARGLFFTNLEDKDKTVVIDVTSHAVKTTWSPACGGDGPRGLAFDGARNLLVVACTDHVQVLDAGHDGAPLGRLDTGAGVDNLDYLEASRTLFIAAGKAAKLTVAGMDDKGQLAVIATAATAEGARNAVADANGNAYVPDAQGARLLVVNAAK